MQSLPIKQIKKVTFSAQKTLCIKISSTDENIIVYIYFTKDPKLEKYTNMLSLVHSVFFMN